MGLQLLMSAKRPCIHVSPTHPLHLPLPPPYQARFPNTYLPLLSSPLPLSPPPPFLHTSPVGLQLLPGSPEQSSTVEGMVAGHIEVSVIADVSGKLHNHVILQGCVQRVRLSGCEV